MQFSCCPGWAICTLFLNPTWGICSFSKTKWQMPDNCPKGDVHAWNWLSHTFVPCFCAVVASQTNSPIKFGSSCRSWENTLNFKHMVTYTQARRIITVSNIDQVIFFLIINVNVLFLSGHNTASKMQRSYDSLEIQSTLISHSPTKCFVGPRWVVTRDLCLPVPRLSNRIYKKRH